MKSNTVFHSGVWDFCPLLEPHYYIFLIITHHLNLRYILRFVMGCFTDPHVFEFEEAKGQSEGAPSPGYCAASRTELPPGRPLASAALPEKRQKREV